MSHEAAVFELSCKVLLVVLFLGFIFLILLAIFFSIASCLCMSISMYLQNVQYNVCTAQCCMCLDQTHDYKNI